MFNVVISKQKIWLCNVFLLLLLVRAWNSKCSGKLLTVVCHLPLFVIAKMVMKVSKYRSEP